MQIVIDIPESILNTIQTDEMISREQLAVLQMHILNGIPLPKGHGRLIDADKTISKICGNSCGCHLEECGYDEPCFSVRRIESVQTIIEADNGESEG